MKLVNVAPPGAKPDLRPCIGVRIDAEAELRVTGHFSSRECVSLERAWTNAIRTIADKIGLTVRMRSGLATDEEWFSQEERLTLTFTPLVDPNDRQRRSDVTVEQLICKAARAALKRDAHGVWSYESRNVNATMMQELQATILASLA